MTDFPSFGNAAREAPLFQKHLFPNVRFACNVVESTNNSKSVNMGLSIVNLKTNMINVTLSRIFTHALESAGIDLITYRIESDSTVLIPNIQFEINISKAISTGSAFSDSIGNDTSGSQFSSVVKTANIDILIENLQLSLFASTLERIKTYMSNSVFNDINP